MPPVRGVDGKFARRLRNGHPLFQQAEPAIVIHAEGSGAISDGQKQCRLRAVDEETGSQLAASRLQLAARCRQKREDRADRHIHSDIGRAVQRIAGDDHRAFRVDRNSRITLFGQIGCHTGPGERFQHDVVGDHIQFLLRVAVGIDRAGRLVEGCCRHPDLGRDRRCRAGKRQNDPGDRRLRMFGEIASQISHGRNSVFFSKRTPVPRGHGRDVGLRSAADYSRLPNRCSSMMNMLMKSR